MVIPQYYENPHILHVNTMPNRAYFIPDARRNDALVEQRETSRSEEHTSELQSRE